MVTERYFVFLHLESELLNHCATATLSSFVLRNASPQASSEFWMTALKRH
jgi:hypothetical protein